MHGLCGRLGVVTALLLAACSDGGEATGSGGAGDVDVSMGGVTPPGPDDGTGGAVSSAGGATSGGTSSAAGGADATGGAPGGAASGGGAPSGGSGAGGTTATGGASNGGAATGGATAGGGESNGGTSNGGTSNGDCPLPTDFSTPVGYGEGTTGGGDATPVVVTSFEEAEAALSAYRDDYKDGARDQLVLRYTGTFDYGTITDVCEQHEKASRVLSIKEMENVTFEGAPGSSANFGIKINRAKNVIVRNMTMGLLPGGGDSDAITIEGNGTNGDVEHVWIDHNELFSSTKDDCPGAGDTEFDGLIDIKKGARYITISYNHLHDHQKTGLLGHSDSDDVDRYVTFHHNWYENVVSRTPLHRFGYVHLYNNLYSGISGSGINVRMGGVALIEKNHFENAANPVTSRYSDEVGYWDLRDNSVGDNITWSAGSDTLANADDWQSTTTFPAGELTYGYTPDAATCVKAIVTATAGATL